jgi:hypothetical protein
MRKERVNSVDGSNATIALPLATIDWDIYPHTPMYPRLPLLGFVYPLPHTPTTYIGGGYGGRPEMKENLKMKQPPLIRRRLFLA